MASGGHHQRPRFQQIRDRPPPPGIRRNCSRCDPVGTLGLCSQIDLDLEVKRSDQGSPRRRTWSPAMTRLLPTDSQSSATQPETPESAFREKRRAGARAGAGGRGSSNADSVFAKLKGLKREGRRRGRGQRSLTASENRRSATSDRAHVQDEEGPRRRSGCRAYLQDRVVAQDEIAPRPGVRRLQVAPRSQGLMQGHLPDSSSRASRIWPDPLLRRC